LRPRYVLDTNVLLHDPQALSGFGESSVLIPIEVIEEIDRFKREAGERGKNARAVSRILDGLRAHGRLSQGVQLPNGGTLRIVLPAPNGPGPHAGGTATVDTRLVALTKELQDATPDGPAVLVTKDVNLRIRADAAGLTAEDYAADRDGGRDRFTGAFELSCTPPELAALRADKFLPLNGSGPRFPNEYCSVVDATNAKHAILARVDASGEAVVPIRSFREGVWGIRPLNREQQYALDALLDDRIRLVTVAGPSGTGKTLLALAAGLQQVVRDRSYRRLVVARPTVPLGKELGYLPGSLEEKLAPWMRPIHDALELLGDLNMGRGHPAGQELLRTETLVVEALSYIRGRSLANQFVIVDEAQNLTPLETKTIVTRAGHGTKIVLAGDPAQIDTPYLDAASCGLAHVVSRFRPLAIAAHVHLAKGERSELAALAATVL
jgi:PhoH-like ATPase